MGKLRVLFITAASVACAVLIGTSTPIGGVLRGAAYFAAGASVQELSYDNAKENGESDADVSADDNGTSPESTYTSATVEPPVTESPTETPNDPPAPQRLGRVINKNRFFSFDDVDYSKYKKNSGEILRYNFGYFDDPNIITLSSGAQVRNYTDDENSALLAASAILPELRDMGGFEAGSDEPQVLIYHTHTSESYLPYGDSYDADYPIRSSDCSKNMTAVGDAICDALAKRGISSVHDCTVYDDPVFTGAYYRSADMLSELVEEYPSIKIAIDIHRDGIVNYDGSVTAPIAEINGRTAAQFMIITGCDSPETDFPGYMENFKLACLLQNCAEKAYPTLARPIMFDYRNYNQSLFEGDLLIEVGSQGNSLDEALYTGELLGDVIADVIERLAE